MSEHPIYRSSETGEPVSIEVQAVLERLDPEAVARANRAAAQRRREADEALEACIGFGTPATLFDADGHRWAEENGCISSAATVFRIEAGRQAGDAPIAFGISTGSTEATALVAALDLREDSPPSFVLGFEVRHTLTGRLVAIIPAGL